MIPDSIREYLDKVDHTEEKLVKLRAILQVVAFEAFRDLDEPAKIRLAIHLYWNCERIHAVTLAKGIFGIEERSVARFLKMIPPTSTDIPCHTCGAPLMASSRGAREYLEKPPKHGPQQQLCAGCTLLASEKRAALDAARDAPKTTNPEPKGLRGMPYGEYLQTDHWKRTAARARNRANYHCQVCNASSALQVHHRDYSRRGAERPEDLICLCEDCHALFHQHSKLAHS